MRNNKSLDDLIRSLDTLNESLEKMEETPAEADVTRKSGPEEIDEFVYNLEAIGYPDMAYYFKITYDEANLPMKKFFEFMCMRSNNARRVATS